GVSHHSPEPARRGARDGSQRALAVVHLAPHAAWAQGPEARLWMGVAVVADAVPARGDLAHQRGMGLGALADQEKGGAGAMGVEQVEDGGCVAGGTIVDRQPDAR